MRPHDALARRLAAAGYEPTARTGVLEERDGGEVVGRTGDDDVVVVGLLSTAPWDLLYTDGPSWSFDAEPHPLPIHEGEHLHLVARPWAPVPPEARRTVVFRHRSR